MRSRRGCANCSNGKDEKRSMWRPFRREFLGGSEERVTCLPGRKEYGDAVILARERGRDLHYLHFLCLWAMLFKAMWTAKRMSERAASRAIYAQGVKLARTMTRSVLCLCSHGQFEIGVGADRTARDHAEKRLRELCRRALASGDEFK